MSSLLKRLLLLVVALQSGSVWAQSVERLLAPAEVVSVELSPDGAYLAMVRRAPDKDTAIIVQRGSMAVIAGAAAPRGQRFHQLTWANEAQVLLEPAADRGPMRDALPTGALMLIGIDGSRRTLLGPASSQERLASVVLALLPEAPMEVLAAAAVPCEAEPCGPGRWRAVRINLSTGEQREVAPAPPASSYLLSTPSGDRLLAAGRDDGGRVVVHEWGDGAWQEAHSFDPQADLGTVPFALDADGSLFALANKRGTAALYRWDLSQNETSELLRDEAADIDDAFSSWAGEALLAVRSEPGFPTWQYLDADHELTALHRSLRAAFPDSDVTITSTTRDHSLAVVLVSSARNDGRFYLVDVRSRSTELLAERRSQLREADLAEVEPFSFTSRDGFALSGYVSVPSGAGPHPTVVLIHDDPYTSRARWAFDAELQLLVARGFAVLQVNYRGSAGLGQYYSASGADQNGRAVQRDIVDGVRWAIEREISDAERICTFGRGYGAFQALKGLTENAGLFACAVAIDGFYDLAQPFVLPETPLLTPAALLAVPSALDTLDAMRAPAARVERVVVPVHLVGESAQTVAMKELLEAGAKDVSWQPSLVDANDYERLLGFLDSQLGGAPAVPTATTASFALALDAAQARQLQAVLARIRTDARNDLPSRVRSEAALRRSIRRLVDSYDDEVRAFVSAEQWALYGDFKNDLRGQLEAELDLVTVQ